jgi:hypothetical protein
MGPILHVAAGGRKWAGAAAPLRPSHARRRAGAFVVGAAANCRVKFTAVAAVGRLGFGASVVVDETRAAGARVARSNEVESHE